MLRAIHPATHPSGESALLIRCFVSTRLSSTSVARQARRGGEVDDVAFSEIRRPSSHLHDTTAVTSSLSLRFRHLHVYVCVLPEAREDGRSITHSPSAAAAHTAALFVQVIRSWFPRTSLAASLSLTCVRKRDSDKRVRACDRTHTQRSGSGSADCRRTAVAVSVTQQSNAT